MKALLERIRAQHATVGAARRGELAIAVAIVSSVAVAVAVAVAVVVVVVEVENEGGAPFFSSSSSSSLFFPAVGHNAVGHTAAGGPMKRREVHDAPGGGGGPVRVMPLA